MGRKTYESIGKPLPGRTNIVITRNTNYSNSNDIIICPSLDEAYNQAKLKGESEAFVIGGAQIINDAIKFADKIYLTEIEETIEGDTFLNPIDYTTWEETQRTSFPKDEANSYPFAFVELERLT